MVTFEQLDFSNEPIDATQEVTFVQLNFPDEPIYATFPMDLTISMSTWPSLSTTSGFMFGQHNFSNEPIYATHKITFERLNFPDDLIYATLPMELTISMSTWPCHS